MKVFPFSSNIKNGKHNIVVDALSRRYTLLSILEAKMLGFEYAKGLYDNNNDFATSYGACEKSAFEKLYRLMCIYLKITNFVYPIVL